MNGTSSFRSIGPIDSSAGRERYYDGPAASHICRIASALENVKSRTIGSLQREKTETTKRTARSWKGLIECEPTGDDFSITRDYRFKGD